MALVDKVAETRLAMRPVDQLSSKRFEMDQYISQILIPQYQQFIYGNTTYPIGLNQTMVGASRTKEVSNTLPNYTTALRRSPPAFAAELVRALVISQARFCFRYKTSSSTPRKQFGTRALEPLENPWTNATTGELISRMEWHAGLAGNAYVTNWEPGRLRVLRPDWTAIVYGSQLEPEDPMGALDGEVIGYVYQNGGLNLSGNKNPVRTLRPSEVAHWSPIPDPLSPGLGMSWVTPALRDIQGDNMMVEYKVKFLENGATPNLVIKGVPGVTPSQFQEWVDKFAGDHDGLMNAYRTIYLSAGADATVVGSDLSKLDFSSTGGYSETRISFLSRVPAALLGISAGLKGSSLNAGNYAETRRTFSDTWVYPTLQDLCAALAPMVDVPEFAELWFDVADIPLLREDAQIAAEIEQTKQTTIVAYVNGGFTPESAVAAVRGQDISLLKHSGLLSVQLQPPGTVRAPSEPIAASANGKPPAPNGNSVVRSQQEFLEAWETGWQARESMQSPVVVNIQPANAPDGSMPITVMPANAPEVRIDGDTINVAPAAVSVPVIVEPAAVSIPVNVQPANAPQVSVPVTVEPAAVSIPVNVAPPDVQIPMTVQPAEVSVPVNVTVAAPTPSKGMQVKRDSEGNVTEVTPK